MRIVGLEYFVLAGETLRFLLDPADPEPQLTRLPVGRDQVRELVDDALASIVHRGPTDALARGFETFIGSDLVERFDKDTHVVIVPHGDLHRIPFAALRTGPEYLIDRWSVSVLPNLQSLRYLRERPRPPSPRSFLAVAAAPGDTAFMLSSLEREARHVARTFGAEPVLGAAAEPGQVLSMLPEADVIHLATHGRFVPGNALQSGLYLNSSEPDASTGAHLTARDILRCGLRATLVVLSACRTGVSEIHAGDELEGLAQTVLYAGASTALVSLWPVDTTATAAYMRRFYRDWSRGQSTKIEAAMAAAQAVRHTSYSEAIQQLDTARAGAPPRDQLSISVEMADLHARARRLNEATKAYHAALVLARQQGLDLDSSVILEDLAVIARVRGDTRAEARHRQEARSLPRCATARATSRHAVPPSEENTPTEFPADEPDHPWAPPFHWAPFSLVGDWL